jgi:hypothetical protein
MCGTNVFEIVLVWLPSSTMILFCSLRVVRTCKILGSSVRGLLEAHSLLTASLEMK